MGPAGEPARGAAPAPVPRKRDKRLFLLVLSLCAGVLAVEGALRVVLFADWMRGKELANHLRREELYASPESADYWKLDVLFRRAKLMGQPHPGFDARTGWLSEEIDPTTLAHADEARLGMRRPVLLFGDSFAQCVDRAGACWQDLLEQSELAPRFGLLNYGVGGYGLDQAVLLSRLALERFRERDPVVVMAILVDDDLERCFLRLRGHPKPWFSQEGDALVAHPTGAADPLAFVRADPPAIRSYLWRGLLFGAGCVERETAQRWCETLEPLSEREALCRRMLVELRDDLVARGLSFFFLLFHGEGLAASPEPVGWQEPFLYRVFEEEHMPFVSSKRWLRQHASTAGVGFETFYYQDGAGLNHFNELGNRIAFEALRQGLLGSCEPHAYLGAR